MAENERDVGEEEAKLRLTIKTTKRKESVQIAGEATVKQLKEEVAKVMGPEAPVESQCLIFAGKILKDDQSVESQAVKDGVTIHLVIRSNKPATSSGSGSGPSSTTARSSSTTSSTAAPPTSSGATPTLPTGGMPPGLSLFGMGGAGGGDLQAQMAQMQQQLMSNPELLRQMMESPMMQNLMSNPEALQSLLTSNPQIQQLMERNPELNHILHNPELMRQAMEMARNPAAMREHMRSQDRQLSNIESLPGGFNALARMYTEIQEPMMDAAQESLQQQLQNNPFAALFGQQQAPPDPGPAAPQGTTNTSPLPNPWASSGSSAPPRTTGTSSSTTTSSTSQSQRGGAGQRQQPPGGTQTQQPRSGQQGTAPQAPPTGGLGAMMQELQRNPELMRQAMAMSGGGAGGGAGAGMANMFAQNPEMLARMMQNPIVQQSMQQMMNNPELMEQAIRNNPLFAGNPEMARASAQMMQSSEMRQLMSNPEALRAMMQVQQGMQQLQSAAPGLFSGQGAMGMMGGVTPPTASATTTTTSTTSSQPATGVGGAGGGASTAQPSVTAQTLQQALSQVMTNQQSQQTQSSSGTSSTASTGQTPVSGSTGGGTGQGGFSNPSFVDNQLQQAEVLYQSQLEQMQLMGFPNRQANLRALVETGGDLNAAVNRLLQ